MNLKTPVFRRICCLLLAAVLTLSVCSCASPGDDDSSPKGAVSHGADQISTEADYRETASPAPSSAEESAEASVNTPRSIIVAEETIPKHADILFEDMVYERPDLDALYAHFEEALELTAADGREEELLELYQTLLDEISQVSTMDTLATLQNEIDLSNEYYEAEMNLLDNELTRIDNRMNDVTEAILTSEYRDAFTAAMGKDFIARYEVNSKLNSPEIEELSDQENALITEYKKLLAQEYTTVYNGVEVSLADLDFSDPDVATPYYEIYEQENTACAEVYLQLVQVRVQIAELLGYDNYADYAYDCLGRDFTREEAAEFAKQVKEYLVPLYTELSDRYYYQLYYTQNSSEVTLEDGFEYLREALSAEFPAAMTEALDYMLDHHLYILDDDPNMMPAGFTTIIDDYAAPFLFINTASYTDPGTLFHEFGHYYNFYLMGSPKWNDSNNLDLAEVHSQGLELLMFHYYDQIYGDDAELMQVSVILDLLYSILSGCCEDEFQQAVFENPDMTVNQMNLLHARLFSEYFGYPVYYEWVEIHHHFETPFYYISYATSAVSAFEIWEIAQSDRSAALDSYRSVTQNTLNCGYLEPLSRAGLSNPFTSDMVQKLADTLYEEYLPDADGRAA